MTIENLRLGRQLCEKFEIPIVKLAEFCDRGLLKAYFFDDLRPILASSQCNTKFKFYGNAIFNIGRSNYNSIIAISKKSIENFNVHVEKIYNSCNRNMKLDFPDDHPNPLVVEVMLWMKKIREINIKNISGEYVIYCNGLMTNMQFKSSESDRERILIYKNNDVFFELNSNEGEISLEYIELNVIHGEINNCIVNFYKEMFLKGFYNKKRVIKLFIKKLEDSLGNCKFVLSSSSDDVIRLISNPFIDSLCCSEVDEIRLKCDRIYQKKYNDWLEYLQQYAVDYFDKEDLSYSNPLRHGVDFFVFDYDEYKKRFHFLKDDINSRKNFFSYIEKLFFDENQFKKLLSYEIIISDIKKDPRKYMIERCADFEKSNADSDTTVITKAYRMAIEGNSWKKIHEKLWPDREQGLPANDKFISGKLDKFESIARANGIPYIKARILRDINETNKEEIVKDMLFQMGVSS